MIQSAVRISVCLYNCCASYDSSVTDPYVYCPCNNDVVTILPNVQEQLSPWIEREEKSLSTLEGYIENNGDDLLENLRLFGEEWVREQGPPELLSKLAHPGITAAGSACSNSSSSSIQAGITPLDGIPGAPADGAASRNAPADQRLEASAAAPTEAPRGWQCWPGGLPVAHFVDAIPKAWYRHLVSDLRPGTAAGERTQGPAVQQDGPGGAVPPSRLPAPSSTPSPATQSLCESPVAYPVEALTRGDVSWALAPQVKLDSIGQPGTYCVALHKNVDDAMLTVQAGDVLLLPSGNYVLSNGMADIKVRRCLTCHALMWPSACYQVPIS